MPGTIHAADQEARTAATVQAMESARAVIFGIASPGQAGVASRLAPASAMRSR